MKPNELMIRDWVANPINGKPMRVMSLTRDVELGLSGFYDEVDPIPLTAEILEKNGFGYKEEDYDNLLHYYLGNEHYLSNPDLYIGTYNNKGVYWLNYCNDAIHGIKYVHQLQHALRFCNIDKEIEI